MAEQILQQIQKEYEEEVASFERDHAELDEQQQAAVFAKLLIKHRAFSKNITFCSENELFVSKTPTGYDVVGYYTNETGTRTPFTVTVCKVAGQRTPSKRYIAADTTSCSGSILLWVLLSLGCTLMGILMYFLMSAAIGI